MQLRGTSVGLVPFGADLVSDRYLGWLSDDEVNRYSQRRGSKPQSREDALRWLAGLTAGETVLAIMAPGYGHIGNIKFGPIDRVNSRSDIAILIGERSSWGQGFGGDALATVTRHLLVTENLNRVDAGSANPSFIALVKRLGWRVEGVLRERVRIGDRLLDWTVLSMLRREYLERQATDATDRGVRGR